MDIRIQISEQTVVSYPSDRQSADSRTLSVRRKRKQKLCATSVNSV